MSDDVSPENPQPEDTPPQKSRWSKIRDSSLFRGFLLALALGTFPLIYDANALRWPWRILILAAAAWLVPAAIRDLRALTDWLAIQVPRLWHNICEVFRRHSKIVDALEILLCCVLLFFSFQVLLKIYGTMATSSLRQDEIDFISGYTSETPFEAATTYNLAKNHIFYAILSSSIPGGSSYHPVRARLWSFVAVSALLFGSLIFFALRRQYLEGTLIFSLLAINQPLLEVLLEARGYGFIAFFAGAGALTALRYLETRNPRWLFAFSLTTVLGTWTLPFYILYGGLLQLLLFILRPAKRTFLYGVYTLLTILLVHSFVLSSMFQVATGYQDKYGLKFVTINKVFESLYFLLPGFDFQMDEKWLIGFILVLIMSPLVLRRRYSPTATMALITFTLGFGFYLYCLIDGTPPMRVVSWVASPLAWCLALLLALYLRHRTLIPLRLPLVALVIFVTTPWAQSRLEKYDFLALQKWLETGEIIHAIVPPGSKIWTPDDYDQQVQAYLDPEIYQEEENVLTTAPDLSEFRNRDGIIVDSLFKNRDQERRIDIDSLPKGTRFVTIPLRINYHRLFLIPPPAEERGIEQITFSNPDVAPLPAERRQPFDPFTLALSWGYGEEMLDEDAEDFENSASAQAFAMEPLEEHQEDKTNVERDTALARVAQMELPGLSLPGSVTFTLETGFPHQRENLAAIFTQTLVDKTVTAEFIDWDGKVARTLKEKDLIIEGELVVVPFPDVFDYQQVRLTFEEAPQSPIQQASYPSVEGEPRPPFTIVDAWITPLFIPEENAENP